MLFQNLEDRSEKIKNDIGQLKEEIKSLSQGRQSMLNSMFEQQLDAYVKKEKNAKPRLVLQEEKDCLLEGTPLFWFEIRRVF